MNIGTMFKKVVSKLVEWSKPVQAAPPASEPPVNKGWGASRAAGAKPASDGFETRAKAPVSKGSDAEFVKGLYRQLLGREAEPEGFQAHMKGLESGMTRDQIQNVFLTSPEFASKQAAGTSGESTFTPAGTPGKLGPVPLEGYDNTKLNNFAHTTVKYQFGRVATNYPLDSVKDKASAEALLKSMVPDLKNAGIKVLDVKGDKLMVQTELGHEWVDVIRGANSGKPGYWWGSEGKAVPGTEGMAGPKMVTPLGGGKGPAQGPSSFAPLSTVPDRPEYATVKIDKSSPSAAAISAATWVKEKYPELFARAEDRNVCVEIMGHVIGAMRAAGYDATRVVNHPSLPQSNGVRYGSDAMVVNGRIYDVYGDMGVSNKPQALDQGPYEAGRLRE